MVLERLADLIGELGDLATIGSSALTSASTI
jgi:hypothetical protein